MKRYLAPFSLSLILAVAALALCIGLTKPFIGHHDGNNKMYRLAAENFLDKGVLTLKGGQLIQERHLPIMPANFYTHHPPLLSVVLAASIYVFGDTESSVRLVPIVFSLATLLVFYFVLRSFFSPKVVLISLLFWAITPMFLYFGKMADHEALTLFFIVLGVYGFIKNIRGLVYLTVFVGQWFGWPAYYLAAILAVFMRSWLLLVLSLANFTLFVSHVSLLTGSPVGGGLADIFLFRTGARTSFGKVQESYTFLSFLRQELSWLVAFFTLPAFLLTIFAFLISLVDVVKTHKLPKVLKVWVIFLFVATVHVFLFKTGAHRHDYWLYYYLPVFSFGVAISLKFFLTKFKTKKNLVLVLFITLLIFAFLRSLPFFQALQMTTSS